jgi:hypothetical protein
MELLAILLVLPFAAFAARQVVVPPLPEAVTPDVEVCTNVALNVNAARLQSLAFSVSFDSCATNEVLVAIGADSDGNGDLSMDEVDVVFGCDCGAWYRADLRTGETAAWPTSSLVVSRREFDPDWNVFKVVRRGRAKSAKASLPTRNASASAS